MVPRHTQGYGGRHLLRRHISHAQQTKNWCLCLCAFFPAPAYAGVRPTLFLVGFRADARNSHFSYSNQPGQGWVLPKQAWVVIWGLGFRAYGSLFMFPGIGHQIKTPTNIGKGILRKATRNTISRAGPSACRLDSASRASHPLWPPKAVYTTGRFKILIVVITLKPKPIYSIESTQRARVEDEYV